jgi:hypothetical protein
VLVSNASPLIRHSPGSQNSNIVLGTGEGGCIMISEFRLLIVLNDGSWRQIYLEHILKTVKTVKRSASLKCNILALVGAILVGAVPLAAAGAKAQSAKAPATVYSSLDEVFAKIPPALTEGGDKEFSPEQCKAINRWLAANIGGRGILLYSGEYLGPLKGSQGATLVFRTVPVSLHRRKLPLRTTAALNAESIKEAVHLKAAGKSAGYVTSTGKKYYLQRGKPGAYITARGTIDAVWMFPDQMSVRLRDASFSAASPPKDATATTQPAGAPAKVHSSIGAILAKIPSALTKGADKEFSDEQCQAINEWLAANIPESEILVHTGEFVGSSKRNQVVSLVFKVVPISIRRRKIDLRAIVGIDWKFNKQVASFTPAGRSQSVTINGKRRIIRPAARGTSITAHGTIASLYLVPGQLTVRLRDASLGQPPSLKRPTATTKPKHRTDAKKDSEMKAARKLRLVKTYLGFDKKDKAIEILKGIIADYPDTPSGKSAADKLKELQGAI